MIFFGNILRFRRDGREGWFLVVVCSREGVRMVTGGREIVIS